MDNAKIQFTVRVDQLPDEVFRKLGEIQTIFEQNMLLLKESITNCNNLNCSKTAENLLKISQDIVYIDAAISDSYNILTGYLEYKTGKLTSAISRPVAKNQQAELSNDEVQ